MSVLEPGVRPRRITLRPGDRYTARLHGGARDGLDFHPVAESDTPNATLQVPEADGSVSLYVWNGFLAQSDTGISAGYTYRAAPVQPA